MIRTIILCLLSASAAFADGEADYLTALQVADRVAQAEHERLGPIYIGLGSETDGNAVQILPHHWGTWTTLVGSQWARISSISA